MSVQHFVTSSGVYIGTYIDGAVPPDGAISVPVGPTDARQIWNGEAWELPLAVAQAHQLTIINTACDTALNALTTTYPSNEVLSWDQQVAEAQAYTASNTAITPLLSAIATASSTNVAALTASVLAKSNAYKAQVGALIGQRQALSNQIQAATTVAAVQGIAWS